MINQCDIDWKIPELWLTMDGIDGLRSFQEILKVFSQEFPLRLQTLRTAIETEDRLLLQREGHRLRSASAYLGATSIQKLCKEMESSEHRSSTDLISILAQIKDEGLKTQTALKNWIQDNAGEDF